MLARVLPSTGVAVPFPRYNDSEWLDKLTSYAGQGIEYDEICNPTSYFNCTRWNFTWQNGRQLATATSSGKSISYTYDLAGIRNSKTVTTTSGSETVYHYITQNGKVVRQTWGSNVMDFIYSRPISLVYVGKLYAYILHFPGDVIRLLNS